MCPCSWLHDRKHTPHIAAAHINAWHEAKVHTLNCSRTLFRVKATLSTAWNVRRMCKHSGCRCPVCVQMHVYYPRQHCHWTCCLWLQLPRVQVKAAQLHKDEEPVWRVGTAGRDEARVFLQRWAWQTGGQHGWCCEAASPTGAQTQNGEGPHTACLTPCQQLRFADGLPVWSLSTLMMISLVGVVSNRCLPWTSLQRWTHWYMPLVISHASCAIVNEGICSCWLDCWARGQVMLCTALFSLQRLYCVVSSSPSALRQLQLCLCCLMLMPVSSLTIANPI